MASELKVVPIPEDRFTDVIIHLRNNFFSDEPLNKAVKLCERGEPHAGLERHSIATLEQGFSRMAVTEDGVIAGVALNGTVKKGEREEAECRLLEMSDEKFKAIFSLLYGVNEKIDLFSKYNVDELFECRILSVDEKFRGRGLASVLMTDSMETAKKAGFKVFKADATGIYSQKVCTNFGFLVEAEISYEDIDEYIRPGPPHKAIKLMAIKTARQTPGALSKGRTICLGFFVDFIFIFNARKRPSSRALPFYMTFHRRQETSRISSRGKGSVYCSKGSGGGTSSNRPTIGRTISSTKNLISLPITGRSKTSAWRSGFIEGKSGRQAACMIIEDHPPLPTRPRQNPHQDTTQRFLNHLVLPKHRTSKFSSNRHRKLQPFRET